MLSGSGKSSKKSFLKKLERRQLSFESKVGSASHLTVIISQLEMYVVDYERSGVIKTDQAWLRIGWS